MSLGNTHVSNNTIIVIDPCPSTGGITLTDTLGTGINAPLRADFRHEMNQMPVKTFIMISISNIHMFVN